MTSARCETGCGLELLPEFGATLVQAEHPHWKGDLFLDPASGQARLSLDGSRGCYALEGPYLEVKWEEAPPDHFIFRDGRYLHVDLATLQPDSPIVFGQVPDSPFRAALRGTRSDAAVHKRVFGLRAYDSRRLPKKASVIVDLGAHIGLASLFFATKYPDASIIAVEPDPGNFALLARNLSQLAGKTVPLQAAIWCENCGLHLQKTDELGNPLQDSDIRVTATGNGAADAVRGWSMNRLIREFDLKHIDILKIDIEGAERELFEAADLSWLDIVDMIFVDTHERFRPGSRAAVLKILDLGFSPLPDCRGHCVFARSPEPEAAAFGSAPAAATLSPRVAVITGYHKEDRKLLERCIRSVRRQTIAADHILVADGFPQDWIDAEDVRHIRLDRRHCDYGATPRGVGSLLAIAEQYDAIGFLDADNYLEPDHLELAFRTAAKVPACDFVIAQRHFRRPDQSIMIVKDEPIAEHVDTNCFLFLPGSFHAILDFALVPRQLSAQGDRIFYARLKRHGLTSAIIPKKTVNYHCLWASTYALIGEEPPPDAKPNIDNAPLLDWIAKLTPRGRLVLDRRTGLKIAAGQTDGAGDDDPTLSREPRRLQDGRPEDGRPQVSTFDVFDTLLARRCIEPVRIFELVEARAGVENFAASRRAAEAKIAQQAHDLDAIYEALAVILGLTPEQTAGLKSLEIEIELENAIPIAENLALVTDGDLLISDMYLSADVVRRMLDKAGFRKKASLIVTADGKRSGRIWPQVTNAFAVKAHLGDNPHSDCTTPTRFGIASRRTSVAAPNVVEKTLLDIGLRDLAAICREARLATASSSPEIRSLQIIQTSLNFPILTLASIALARFLQRQDMRAVLFSSRDCNLWLPLFRVIARGLGLEVPCDYFYTSRIARTKPSADYLAYARQNMQAGVLVVDICGTGWSLAHLFRRLEMDDRHIYFLHKLPPARHYEACAPTPKNCTIHGLLKGPEGGCDNERLEMCNYAEHGMVVDVRRIGHANIPVFELDHPPRIASAIEAQHGSFMQAVDIFGKQGLKETLSLDDASIEAVCIALYRRLSKEQVLQTIFFQQHRLEEQRALKSLGCM